VLLVLLELGLVLLLLMVLLLVLSCRSSSTNCRAQVGRHVLHTVVGVSNGGGCPRACPHAHANANSTHAIIHSSQ
jgi:hypothetical protein